MGDPPKLGPEKEHPMTIKFLRRSVRSTIPMTRLLLGATLLLSAMASTSLASSAVTAVPEFDPGVLTGGLTLLAGLVLVVTNRRRPRPE